MLNGTYAEASRKPVSFFLWNLQRAKLHPITISINQQILDNDILSMEKLWSYPPDILRYSLRNVNFDDDQ